MEQGGAPPYDSGVHQAAGASGLLLGCTSFPDFTIFPLGPFWDLNTLAKKGVKSTPPIHCEVECFEPLVLADFQDSNWWVDGDMQRAGQDTHASPPVPLLWGAEQRHFWMLVRALNMESASCWSPALWP